MSENETAISEGAAQASEPAPAASNEEITYHAVEKDGVVTAIWEMQGRKPQLNANLDLYLSVWICVHPRLTDPPWQRPNSYD